MRSASATGCDVDISDRKGKKVVAWLFADLASIEAFRKSLEFATVNGESIKVFDLHPSLKIGADVILR